MKQRRTARRSAKIKFHAWKSGRKLARGGKFNGVNSFITARLLYDESPLGEELKNAGGFTGAVRFVNECARVERDVERRRSSQARGVCALRLFCEMLICCHHKQSLITDEAGGIHYPLRTCSYQASKTAAHTRIIKKRKKELRAREPRMLIMCALMCQPPTPAS
jgi:hypothetical protein